MKSTDSYSSCWRNNSGTSLRGRARVSHKANKQVKMLLHMAAMASLISGDVKRYFERKTEEGKNKMSVVNAVRNKLIQRLFIKEDRLYRPRDERHLIPMVVEEPYAEILRCKCENAK